MNVRNIRVSSLLQVTQVELESPSQTPPIVQFVTDIDDCASVIQAADTKFIRGEEDNTVYVAVMVRTDATEGVLTIIEF